MYIATLPSGLKSNQINHLNIKELSDMDLIWLLNRDNYGSAELGIESPHGVYACLIAAHGELLSRVLTRNPGLFPVFPYEVGKV